MIPCIVNENRETRSKKKSNSKERNKMKKKPYDE